MPTTIDSDYALALPSSVLGVRGKNDVGAGEQVHEGRAVNGARGRESMDAEHCSDDRALQVFFHG